MGHLNLLTLFASNLAQWALRGKLVDGIYKLICLIASTLIFWFIYNVDLFLRIYRSGSIAVFYIPNSTEFIKKITVPWAAITCFVMCVCVVYSVLVQKNWIGLRPLLKIAIGPIFLIVAWQGCCVSLWYLCSSEFVIRLYETNAFKNSFFIINLLIAGPANPFFIAYEMLIGLAICSQAMPTVTGFPVLESLPRQPTDEAARLFDPPP